MMHLRTCAAAALLAALTAACNPPQLHGKGGTCQSLSECKPGLACIAGRCSSKLDEIAGRVPDYSAREPAEEAPADAGVAADGGRDDESDDAAVPGDAG